jgi:hypothetical protein
MIPQNLLDDKALTLRQLVQQMLSVVVEASQDSTPMHEVEQSLLRLALQVGRSSLQLLLDHCGPGDVGETFQTPEGKTLKRLDNLHARPYLSIFGEFELKRYVYGSREGQQIEFIPLDARLALPEGKFSYLLQDWDQSLCVEQPFDQVAQTIEKILGLRQHVDSLERMSRQMAEDVDAFHAQQAPPPPKEEQAIVVQTADCKGVPIRRGADAPIIYQHRSTSGPKPGRKKMAVLGCVYSVAPYVRTPEEVVEALFRPPGEPREDVSVKRPRPCHKRVRACLTHINEEGEPIQAMPAVFGWLADETAARNPQGAKPLVCLMDGQEALWQARQTFQSDTKTVDILDLLHVTPRLWEAAHLFHAPQSQEAEAFVRDRTLRVLRGQAAGVIGGMRRMATTHKLPRRKRALLGVICNFLRKNLSRMCYDEYLSCGYPIASGVIEGACRHVVKDRLERTGMSWTLAGAQAMLELRCAHISEQWKEFMTFHIEREIRRVHPYRQTLTALPHAIAA